MGALTETEIFDRMFASFALAIELCDDLAVVPLKGPTYNRFRYELRLIEGCAKQANCWREDTRWLFIGRAMAEVHKRAGDWLRGIKMPDGTRRKLTPGIAHPAFLKLAECLRGTRKIAEDIRTKATGRVGMILPTPLPGPHRDTVPIGWTSPAKITNVTPGGIIIPKTVSWH